MYHNLSEVSDSPLLVYCYITAPVTGEYAKWNFPKQTNKKIPTQLHYTVFRILERWRNARQPNLHGLRMKHHQYFKNCRCYEEVGTRETKGIRIHVIHLCKEIKCISILLLDLMNITCESVLLSYDAIAHGCKHSSFIGQLNGYFRPLENAWQTNVIIN